MPSTSKLEGNTALSSVKELTKSEKYMLKSVLILLHANRICSLTVQLDPMIIKKALAVENVSFCNVVKDWNNIALVIGEDMI
jgi:hypothetical protein